MFNKEYIDKSMAEDYMFNIKFVKEVEKYPCLYDSGRQDHGRIDSTDKAWATIGAEIKLSVAHCKKRWKNLRTTFARSRKKYSGVDSGQHMKKYYLNDAMQFLAPYLKSRSENSFTEETVFVNCDSRESTQRDNSSDLKSFFHETNRSIEDVQRISEEPTAISISRSSNAPKQNCDKCFIDYLNSENGPISQKNNPDLEFLKSLLPDITKMNDFQKRQFKKRTLDVIDSILSDGPSQGSLSTNEQQNTEVGYIQHEIHKQMRHRF